MSDTSPMPTTTRVPKPITALTRLAGALATFAILAIVAACSTATYPSPSVATTPAATATPTATPAGTPASTPATTPAETASPGGSEAAVTMPPGTPELVEPFISAGIATTVDAAAHAVDPSTYRTTIPGDQYTAVYVVFALKPNTVGKVTMVMTLNGIEVAQHLTLDYGANNSWGHYKIDFQPLDRIPAGVYKAVMTFEPTGAEVTQFFTVE